MSSPPPDYLALDDADLLTDCDVHIYKSSGPGGQHRNKVSSAVRLKHRPTGVTAQGEDSRSQHANKRSALRRLRMNIACQGRRQLPASARISPVVAGCIHKVRKSDENSPLRLTIGARDRRFWQVAAFLLDVLESRHGRMGESAAMLGISTGNLNRVLHSERHLFAAVQQLRKRHGERPLS